MSQSQTSHLWSFMLLLICSIMVTVALSLVLSLNRQVKIISQSATFHPTVNVNITRILIAGYAHSGTSYITQFIGQVIFGNDSVFYWFEPTHIKHMHLFQHFYAKKNMSMSVNIDHIQTLTLLDFFNCTFVIKQDKMKHYDVNMAVNHIGIDDDITQKCLSKKILIFKTIHYHSYQSYEYLWKYYPNLIIIQLIRNPIKHIPSRIRLRYKHRNWGFHTMEICHKQLDGLQYLINEKHFVSPLFNLWKQEEFFQNIQENLFNQTVENLYSLFFDNNASLDIILFINRFKAMHIEGPGKLKPASKPEDQRMEYMLRECKQFMLDFGYNYSDKM